MTEPILKITNLSKSFRSHWTFRPIKAVKDVSLEILPGESFGFLGHNGAGKTSTIKCIVGLIQKTSGSIEIDGQDASKVETHSKIGYLPEHPYFYDHLSVIETLDFFASLHEIGNPDRKRIVEETLELVQIAHKRNSPVRALSKGLQQKLGFAQAIINRPKLLLLDEPFSGIDPLGRQEIRQLIRNLNNMGTSIFMSSHILSDIQDICDRVSIMTHGELKAILDLREVAPLASQTFEVRLKLHPRHHNFIREQENFALDLQIDRLPNGKQYVFQYANYEHAQRALGEALKSGAHLIEFKAQGAKLEDVFIEITRASKNAEFDQAKEETCGEYL